MTYGPFRGEQEHRTHRRRRSGGRATDQGELWQEERGNGNTMIRRRNKPPSPPAVPDRIHGETRHVASPMSLVTSPVVGYRQPRPRRPPLDTSPAAVRKHGVDCRDSGTNSASRYEDARELARRDSDDSSPYGRGYGVAVTTNVWDLIYTVDMMIGTQVMPMEIDTGSSDTWVVGNNFSCVFPDLKKAPVSGWRYLFSCISWRRCRQKSRFLATLVCSWGYVHVANDVTRKQIEFCAPAATFAGSFSGGWRNDTDFRIMYVSGEFMRGRFGYEDVEIAGITVRQQQVALVTLAYTNFGGALGGVLGLGFPLLTSDPSGVRKRYDPIVTTMIKQGAVSEPMFSVALSRNFSSSESFIAFGGMPPVAWDESTMVSVPVLNLELISSWPEMETEPSFFTIVPDGWVFGDAVGNVFVNKTRIPVIVDTGATFTRLPTDMAHLLYSLYSPPAAYYEEAGHWVAPCNATTPTFGVEFAGRVFYMHRQDLLNEHWGTEDLCLVGIQDAGKDYYVMLGQSWLHNVVSVFDVGQLEMRFAARYYR